jgi:hypothetical protein
MRLHRDSLAFRSLRRGSLAVSCLTVSVFLSAGITSAQSADPAAGVNTPPPPHQKPPPVISGGGNSHAVDFTPGSGSCGGNQDQNIGWQFDVLSAITVDAMTWFDDGQNGTERSHEVGIFDPVGNLIVSTHVTIPAGAGAPLDGIWRSVAISPTVLPPGSGYIVGGYNGAHSECLNFNVSQTVIPQITYIDATFSGFTGSFERPTNFSAAVNGFYGVGFQVSEEVGTKFCVNTNNSTGAPADLSAAGSSSSSAGDLVLTSAPVPNQNGIFFHGANPSQTVFGNGFMCATGNIVRGAVVPGVGNSASYAYDNSNAQHSLAAFVGSTRYFQHWFRDPAGGMQTTITN